MKSIPLAALADEQLARARHAHNGRAAHTIHGGHNHALRQTLLVITARHGLGEHNTPGAATPLVLRGRVRLHTGADNGFATTGDYLAIPAQRHRLHALEDSVILLTVLTDHHATPSPAVPTNGAKVPA